MFAETPNPYKFQYLITGISGEGIREVFLPEQPPDDQILFKAEQKFVRSEPSEQLKAWMDEMVEYRDKNENYVHARQTEINDWEEQEFDRCQNGIWFWNNKVPTYLTGDHYKYLTQWQLYFGFPDYWDADREVFYWQQFWEEDPQSYGGALNTGRRTGKSAKMGFWIANRTSTNFKHFAGMQGEDNTKIMDFYNQFVLDPFYLLPYYSQPEYDTTTLQKKGIVFKETPRRNKKRKVGKKLVLGSKMDYRTSEANKYDQAVLHSYAGEEFGKTMVCSVWDRWKFIKPCLHKGIYIRGKAYIGTTCEYMDVTNKGGKAYKKLCFSSDYNVRNKLGRTISGLYAALLPHDCILEGFIDEHGIPMRDQARKWILDERDAVRGNPKDYSDLVRKHPLNWPEVFYVSADRCMFNAERLQDRKTDLMVLNGSHIRKFDLKWENNVRLTRIVMVPNEVNGWLKTTWLPREEVDLALLNRVDTRLDMDPLIGEYIKKCSPMNDTIFGCGTDPIDHGVVIETEAGEDDFINSRRSKPVVFVKRKYDSAIDGHLTQEILEKRAKEKFPYKTNRYLMMMDTRPQDPNVYFERTLMICWLMGVSLNCEAQKPGVMNWFRAAGCEDFIWTKYVPDQVNPYQVKKTDMTDGTPASTMMIQEYTSCIATDVEYFAHTYPFIEQVDDLLVARADKTKEHDYYSGMGWTELGCRMKPKRVTMPVRDIKDFMPKYDRFGNIVN